MGCAFSEDLAVDKDLRGQLLDVVDVRPGYELDGPGLHAPPRHRGQRRWQEAAPLALTNAEPSGACVQRGMLVAGEVL